MIKVGGGKLEEHPETLERWHRGENPGPLVAEVSLTGGCNHGCRHCGYQLFTPYDTRKSFIPTEAYHAFLRDFRAMGGVEIFYAGRGEPLLNPDIVEHCRLGHELGIRNVMSSNGVPLGERRMAELMRYMTWVRFSVNGGDPATYADIHQCPPADFEKLVRNLAAAANFRDAHSLPVKLIIQFIFYERNAHSLPALVETHRRVGTDQLVIRNVYDRDSRPMPVSEEARAVLAALDGKDGVTVRWETFATGLEQPRWTRCLGINFRINIDETGNAYTCPRNNFQSSVFGNIVETSFAEIWNSPRRREVFADIEPGGYIPKCSQMCDVSKDNIYAEDHVRGHGEPVRPGKAAHGG